MTFVKTVGTLTGQINKKALRKIISQTQSSMKRNWYLIVLTLFVIKVKLHLLTLAIICVSANLIMTEQWATMINSKLPKQVEWKSKSIGSKWKVKIITIKIIPFMVTEKVFWGINTEKMIYSLTWKSKPRKTLSIIMAWTLKMGKKLPFTSLKHFNPSIIPSWPVYLQITAKLRQSINCRLI
jgi:hypothetical protein